jgi:hypothetical protein
LAAAVPSAFPQRSTASARAASSTPAPPPSARDVLADERQQLGGARRLEADHRIHPTREPTLYAGREIGEGRRRGRALGEAREVLGSEAETSGGAEVGDRDRSHDPVIAAASAASSPANAERSFAQASAARARQLASPGLRCTHFVAAATHFCSRPSRRIA